MPRVEFDALNDMAEPLNSDQRHYPSPLIPASPFRKIEAALEYNPVPGEATITEHHHQAMQK